MKKTIPLVAIFFVSVFINCGIYTFSDFTLPTHFEAPLEGRIRCDPAKRCTKTNALSSQAQAEQGFQDRFLAATIALEKLLARESA